MLLSPEQFQQFSQAAQGLSATQLAWVGGYLSGLAGAHSSSSALSAPAPTLSTVLYGSQTGNSKKLAEQLQQQLLAQGKQVKLYNLKDYRPQQLKQEQHIYLIISTHGNGEAPDEARSFYNFLHSARAPRLEQLSYAVLALGDSSYEAFCQTGIDLDQRLAALGAKRLLERVECDVDFAQTAQHWLQQVVAQTPVGDAANHPFPNNPVLVPSEATALYSSTRPFAAPLLNRIQLTDNGSSKVVLHVELSLEASGLQYQPGDILVTRLANPAELVEAVLAHSGLAADTPIELAGTSYRLDQALSEHLELSTLTRRQLKAYAELSANPTLLAQASDTTALQDFIRAADWADVFRTYPAQLSAAAFVKLLRPLQERQYSIASSPSAHPDEVHLLVKHVDYVYQGRRHLGCVSTGLARLALGDTLAIYVKSNPHFRLPADPQTKVIMIGAGTGVAPYRSFLFEREALGIQGNTWLFFGEQQFRTDFLYQTEWQAFLKHGTLERMSVAFSRDQAEKRYVQHGLLENSTELYQWLMQGAHVYVCGDRHGMAKDVHAALLQIAQREGGHSSSAAHAWLEELITTQRYQRDVY